MNIYTNKEYFLREGIPEFFSRWRVQMKDNSDLGLYEALDKIWLTPPGFKLVVAFMAGKEQNVFIATSAGDLIRALGLSLWHNKHSRTDDIFQAVRDIDTQLAEVVEQSYWMAKRKQSGYFERAKVRVLA